MSETRETTVKLGACTWDNAEGCVYPVGDQYGKTLQDCKDHFPFGAILPFRGYPKTTQGCPNGIPITHEDDVMSETRECPVCHKDFLGFTPIGSEYPTKWVSQCECGVGKEPPAHTYTAKVRMGPFDDIHNGNGMVPGSIRIDGVLVPGQPTIDRSDAADAKRLRWMLNGQGYFMEEVGLCGHGPCDEAEQDDARIRIDAAMG